ncbi:MAG: TetR/AcrR family transcriptional regulator, partial [Betaproteobacteria bacterium]
GAVAREPAQAPLGAAFVQGLDELVSILATVEPQAEPAAGRRAALADYATMVGALMLARATEGQPISTELLAAARERLLPAAASALDVPTPAARHKTKKA